MTSQTGLNQRQKAAVIVRLLLDDDEVAGLDRLDSESQALLAQEMAGMEVIDRQTRDNAPLPGVMRFAPYPRPWHAEWITLAA